VRIFETDGKTNYVDTNDVLVGFDAWQSCCETFGHKWAYKPEFPDDDAEDKPEPANLEAMVFDTNFFKDHDHSWGGGEVMFRLVVPELQRTRTDEEMRRIQRRFASDKMPFEAYLILFNHHNGYYSHGFELTVGGEIIRDGGI